MVAARKVGLRVNGVRAVNARVLLSHEAPQLVITYPQLGEFSVDESSILELLELVHPRKTRSRLPNGGWRRVPLRILIALVRGGIVRVVEES